MQFGQLLRPARLQLLLVGVEPAVIKSAREPAIAKALEGAGALLQQRREMALQRQSVIDTNAMLQERELIKLASLASALADALRKRGVDDPAASLTAEAGIAVFKIAFARWINERDPAVLPEIIRKLFDDLKTVTAGGP